MPLLDDLLSGASQALGAVSEALAGASTATSEARNAPPQQTPARATPAADVLPNRTGFIQGVPASGFDADAAAAATGAAQNTTRAEWLECLWEEYVRCPWAWDSVNVIARTVTAGGLLMRWDGDDGEGDTKQPAKPPGVMAMERLFAFCNPEQDIRQLMRNATADLQVFGGAMVEIVWFAGIPVALYNQDFPTTVPDADQHGNVRGYKQTTEDGRTATFKADQIIHITLDSARPSVFGISPTHAAEESIVAWMFLHACEKEAARRGLPPNIHVDLPPGMPDPEVERWQNKHATRNLGPGNVGTPITTKGGGKVNELQTARLPDILAAKKEARNEIVSTYGVPPAKVGIIESGNLGGGTGSDQNKSFWLDIIAPIAALIAEKLQFRIAVRGFGVTGWHVEFGGVDYRDDQTIENIRDMRLRNGSWTLNRLRADIGEPGVPGGDDAVLVARQDIVLWADMKARSAASVAQLEPVNDVGGPGGVTGPPPAKGTTRPASLGGARTAQPPSETVAEHTARLTARQRAYNQLVREFPSPALKWVNDPGVTWYGPVNILPAQIDTDARAQWNATKEPGKVAAIKRRYKRTGKMKPIVVIRAPGADRDVICNGHHHFVAAEELGIAVKAFVAHVPSRKGRWTSMAMSQHERKPRESAAGRLSKDEAGYAKAASPDMRCGTCTMFSDDRCGLVAGDIDPGFVCSQWQAEGATGAA